jgi:multisubunit Na+/H+ antiporter MnhE subunit
MNAQERGGGVAGVLTVVVDTPTVQRAVEYTATRLAPAESVHLLALARDDDRELRTASLLSDASRWAARNRTVRDSRGGVVRSGRTVDGRWPTPDDVAAVVAAYAHQHGIDRVFVPADFESAFSGVSAGALVASLRDAGIDDPAVVPAGRFTVHRRLLVAGSTAGTAALFVLSLAFYLLLAGRVDTFEVVTGVATAAVVASVFRTVAFETPPSFRRSGSRVLRGLLYVPYLLWEVARANLAIAAIVLHPRLPIDPKLVSYPTDLRGELALTTFANSITLTPGTLTVDVDADEGTLLVHTLTDASRTELASGSLERALRFVFGGDGDEGGDALRPASAPRSEVSDD